MSFFGLTALGPENFISSSKVDSNGFTLFSIEEFKKGFEKVCKLKNSNGVINLSHIKDFLHYTFGFSPLNDEINEFINMSGKTNPQDELKWNEISSILSLIKENIKSKSIKSVKYTSYQKFHDDTFKHRRKEFNPDESFKNPITYSQNYGFYKFSGRNINKVAFPKRKCEETKYAENLLMTGRFGR